MLRTFREHEIRRVESLDGLWDFITAINHKGRRLPTRFDTTLWVPSCWELQSGLENYRGQAWYHTHIQSRPGLATRLVFGGVSHTADVFVDGRKTAHHYDAYTPFEVILPPGTGVTHDLVVRVDNTFGPHSSLHMENDYMTYGGITRPVELQHVPVVFIERMHATPRRSGNAWNLEYAVRIRNCSRHNQRRSLELDLEGGASASHAISLKPGETRTVRGVLTGLKVEPWSAASPRLYRLTTRLLDGGASVDDLIDRVGFREIRVQGRNLVLNGRPIRLRGYNRHEDHGLFGCALPVEAMAVDLSILRDLGCNFVRTSHYPNDMRFLDLCDELGFFVWEESHARGVKVLHPRFKEQITASTTEMVDWHWNHPSIVIWGCLNECWSNKPEHRDSFAYTLRLLKRLDSSRPTSFASCYHENELCFGLADIVSMNRYDAWYSGTTTDVEPALRKILRWIDSPKSRGARGKPVILSEFGAAAVYGCRNPSHVKWTEEYQSDVLDECLRVYLNHPRIAGAAIWQFADCRVSPGHWHTRARTHNNKGTVDELRRRKLSYQVVQRRMREAARRLDR